MNMHRKNGFVSLWAINGSPDSSTTGGLESVDESDVQDQEVLSEGMELELLSEEVLSDTGEPESIALLIGRLLHSTSFLDQALNAARRKNVGQACGITASYDCAYDPSKVTCLTDPAVTFIGFFPFTAVSAALWITHRDLKPDEVTALLKVEPSATHEGLWVLESCTNINSSDPAKHIGWVLDQVAESQSGLAILNDRDYSMELNCRISTCESSACVNLPKEQIERIAALKIRFQCRMFVQR